MPLFIYFLSGSYKALGHCFWWRGLAVGPCNSSGKVQGQAVCVQAMLRWSFVVFSHFSFRVFVCPAIKMGIGESNAGSRSRYSLEWASINLKGVETPLVVSCYWKQRWTPAFKLPIGSNTSFLPVTKYNEYSYVNTKSMREHVYRKRFLLYNNFCTVFWKHNWPRLIPGCLSKQSIYNKFSDQLRGPITAMEQFGK